jgi:hypothetical protein
MAVQQAPETMKTPFLTDWDAHRFRDVFEFVKRITAPDFDVTSLGSDTIREWDAKFDETLTDILGCK